MQPDIRLQDRPGRDCEHPVLAAPLTVVLLSVVLLSLLGACAAPLELRPLATGRADIEAFELRGADIAMLRREAQRRCPQGADVLRQAESGQPLVQVEGGRFERWTQVAAQWVDPPQRQAQMLVLCRPDPQRLAWGLIPPAPASAPIATAAADPSPSRHPYGEGPPADDMRPSLPPVPAPPIGPIDPTW